jgi:Na+/H+ antiporter NhaC
MYEAERRTKANETINDVAVESKEDLSPAMGVPLRWYNGVLPIAAIIIITAIGLVITGLDNAFLLLKEKNFVGDGTYQSIWANLHRLSDAENVGFFERLGIVIGNTGSHIALLWASLTGLTLSILLTVTQKIMTLEQTMNTALTGFKTILPAMLILVLAWSVGTLTKELQTATFLASVLQDTLSPALMPVAIFILAGAIAFATGSSWSTMAILYPIAIPATWAICMANGMEQAEALPILYNVIATVLAAAVFGDHCSPISDTTILSSLATNCNHIDHVRTQMPYALVVGLVSVFMGWFAAAFAFHLVVNFAIGIALLWGVIRVFGKKIE